MRSAVVVQWSRLGDVLQTRPLLRSLKRAAYDRVILSSDIGFSGIVNRMPEEPEWWPLDLAKISAAARHSTSHADVIRLLGNLFQGGSRIPSPDVYVLTRSTAAALFAQLLNPHAVYGYELRDGALAVPDQMRWMESAMERHRGIPVHLADIFASLNPFVRESAWLPPILEDRAAAAMKNGEQRVVGILCDAGESYRSIPREWLAGLVKSLTADLAVRIELYGKSRSAESDALIKLWQDQPHSIADLRGQTSLDQLCEALANADLVIGPDTGGLHMAAAFGTPVIGLYFGGAVCFHTGPYAERSVVLQNVEWNDANADGITALTADMLNDGGASLKTCDLPVFHPHLDDYGMVYAPSDADLLPSELSAPRAEFFAQFLPRERTRDTAAVELSVIIPEKGNSHYTDDILFDLKHCAAGLNVEILVVSSGCKGEYVECAEGSLPIRYICRPDSLTFSEACNLGAKEASGKWLLFLNNDCRVKPDFLRSLLHEAEENVLMSPLIRYPDGTIQNAGVAFDANGIHEIAHASDNVDAVVKPQALSAVALLMRSNIFSQFGGFDTAFRNGYEDLDLCLRASERGCGMKIAKTAEIIHFRGSTDGRFNEDENNRRLFVERWHRIFDSKRHVQVPGETGVNCPIVMVSHESAAAAGSRLRWIWPLLNRGFRQDVDFKWLHIPAGEALDDHAAKMLAGARTIVVFRPLQSVEDINRIEDAMVRTRAKLIVDADDLFLNRFGFGSPRAAKHADFESGYLRLLHLADNITVSTSFLREQLSAYGYNADILPLVPCRQMRQSAPKAPMQDHRKIGFFGTPAHHLDLGGIIPAIERILDLHDDVFFYWWGCRPGPLMHHPRVRQGGPLVDDYTLHLQRLARFGLHVAVTPLLDSPASQARSPIKYYEYALSGIPAVYSRIAPYSAVVAHEHTGLLAGESTREWIAALDALLSDETLRDRLRTEAQNNVLHRMNDRNLQNEMNAALNKLFPESSVLRSEKTMSVSCPL